LSPEPVRPGHPAQPAPAGTSADDGGAQQRAAVVPLLRAHELSRSYDAVQAVSEVSLQVRPQEVIGLIGPNGAGKTTLINLLTGFDLPTTGTIEFDGQDITRWSAPRRARNGLARTFQHGRLFSDLSLRENVELAALGVGMRERQARQLAGELLDALELVQRADVTAAALSHGEQQKAGVARALATRPRFVLLDEPAAGLSESDVDELAALLANVRGQYGASVLVVEHNIGLIMRVADRIHVLDGGRTLAEGTPAEIRENLDVTAAYLGSAGTDATIEVPSAGDG
jgi:branched-chain amino acid transport system ATP-binding protein